TRAAAPARRPPLRLRGSRGRGTRPRAHARAADRAPRRAARSAPPPRVRTGPARACARQYTGPPSRSGARDRRAVRGVARGGTARGVSSSSAWWLPFADRSPARRSVGGREWPMQLTFEDDLPIDVWLDPDTPEWRWLRRTWDALAAHPAPRGHEVAVAPIAGFLADAGLLPDATRGP